MSDCSRQHGFALLVLLAIIGVGSVGILLAVQGVAKPVAENAVLVDNRLGSIFETARLGFRRAGAFPATLDAVAAVGTFDAQGEWRRDPHGLGADFVYLPQAAAVEVRSRGGDRTLATADDIVLTANAETQVRARQRARLRLIRAVYLRRLIGLTQGNGGGNGNAANTLRAALHDYAIARRSWLTATNSERGALTGAMNSATARVQSTLGPSGVAAVPVHLTGSGGLLQWLGMPDTRGTDGKGQLFRLQLAAGVIAIGNDGSGGTDDDM